MTTEILELVESLSAKSATDRCGAAEQLMQFGEEAKIAAVALVQASADSSAEVREYAVAALEELGAPRHEDLDRLTDLLGSDHPDVGYWAATLLGRLGPSAASAVDALAGAVAKGPSNSVRERAAWALGKIGPGATGATMVLRSVAEGNSRLARVASGSLERIGG